VHRSGLPLALLCFGMLCCRHMALATDGAHNVEWKWIDAPLSIVDEQPAMVMVQSPWLLQQGSENKMSLHSSGNAVTILRPHQCPSTSPHRLCVQLYTYSQVLYIHRTSYLAHNCVWSTHNALCVYTYLINRPVLYILPSGI
jgi:hypothetical protein